MGEQERRAPDRPEPGHPDPAPFQDGLVADLALVGAGMLPSAGGKAVNLGLLLGFGFPVPAGFCVGTQAYHRMARAAGLDELLADLDAVPSGDQGALTVIAARARAALTAAPVPEDIARALRSAYLALGPEVKVAVRSSATAEDLPAASFAGQQETYLDVAGFSELLGAVRHCWASVWTDRAVVYRALHGIEQKMVGAAVVVQEMVQSVTAGVLFTANPLTGRRNEAVIDASGGLGEAVVSGRVNPDHFVVDLSELTITARAPAVPDAACLSDAQVLALAAVGARAQEAFGAPQDLEWAIDAKGAIWLLQSRPITTLYPLPEQPPADLRVYVCASLIQGLTRPLTPMGMAAFQAIGSSRPGLFPAGDAGRAAESVPYRDIGQRLFMDVTPIVRSTGGRWLISKSFRVADTRSWTVLQSLVADPRFAVVRWPRRAAVRGIVSVLQTLRPLDVLRLMLNPGGAERMTAKAVAGLSRTLVISETATAAQRLEFAEHVLTRGVVGPVWDMLPPMEAGFSCLGIARLLLRGMVQPGELQTVLRGLPNNVTTVMDLELWNTALAVRDDPASAQAFRVTPPEDLARSYVRNALPEAAQEALRSFLDRYGHRAVAEIDVGMPRWSEDPTYLLGAIANYLRLTDPELAPDRQFARAAALADAKVAELVSRAAGKGPLRGRLVALCLERTRRLAGMRELPKFHLIIALAEVHRQLGLVGAELASSGRVGAAGDIFFLDFSEARVGLRGVDLAELVEKRRRAYAQELRRRHIPRVLLSDGTDVEAAAPRPAGAPPGALLGSPASAGTVTGRARVVLDPVAAHLEPGEILVVPSADPGWTPLFLTAGALVMEMGGAVSHAAVIAREYGIPAVVGVPDATSRIVSGQIITVDGAAGTVQLSGLQDPPPTG